jgi:5-methylcytosine-specific restriction endonuclease McrA
MPQNDDRYHNNWGRKSWQIRHSNLLNRCTYCWLLPAKETHHLHYRDLFGLIKGRERAWFDCVPLCQTCHDLAHRKWNWKSHSDPNRRHNYWLYKFDARLRFLCWKVITAPITALLKLVT